VQLALALTLILGLGCGASEAGIEGVLLVTVDTLRADHLSAYGGPDPTPAFDAVAAEGVLVERAYTPTPSTGPAHASLFTGLYPWRHGVLQNAAPLPDELVTLAMSLRERGFRTAAFVSSFILDGRFGFDRGFESYGFEATEKIVWRGQLRPRFYARGAATTDAALRWLHDHRGERFFLWIHYFDPHAPYEPPEGFALPPGTDVDLDGRRVPSGLGSRSRLGDLVRAYRGEVRYTDAELGRLLDSLREDGRLDRIALVVTSDHGEAFGDHGQLGHGTTLYEELVRVPLLVRGPGIPAGRRLPGPVQLEDLMPTLLDWLGLPVPPDLDGVSLLGWLRGAGAPPPRHTVLGRRRAYTDEPDLFFARSGEIKWIGHGEDFDRYDLSLDPRELAALRESEPPGVLHGPMQASLGQGSRELQLEPEVREALEALGYVD
jgi:arylsulfatase A-like enzyme